MPKTILCYGDSNTWGFDPSTKLRFPEDVRWPGVLQGELGKEYRVIAEALNGRTTVWDDPIEEHRNGKRYLIPCLDSHRPIDLVVLMLGTNDLKKRFSVSASDIGRSVGLLLGLITGSGAGPYDPAVLKRQGAKGAPPPVGTAPQVLLICPPAVGKLTEFAEMFEGAPEKSRKLPPVYRQQAELHGCSFLDAGQVVKASDLDGIHLDKDAHRALAKAVAGHARQKFE